MGVGSWNSIQPLTINGDEIDFAEIDSLYGQWLNVKTNAEQADPDIYHEFNQQLHRNWAIETGIIERLYELDSGVTQTLIEKGIVSDYIERNSTNKEPDELTAILNSHVNTVDAIYGWIKESRPLSAWFLKSIHQSITETQHTYRAMDTLGRSFDAQLQKGQFKKLPNNPIRSDGTIYIYCPPEQVDSEIDKLIVLYDGMQSNQEIHPLTLGAWLHHRFSQIHPFQDGNGRVGRALLTWHLVKVGYLPVVISNETRDEYLDALEDADEGSLSSLTSLLVRLEKNTILSALNVTESDAIANEEAVVIDQVVDYIADRFNKRKKQTASELRSVHDIASQLRTIVKDNLRQSSEGVKVRLSEQIGMGIETILLIGGPDQGNDYWYRRQVSDTALRMEHWVNFNEPRYFVRLRMNVTNTSQIPRMDFVISLHNVGSQLTGVMAAVAFAEFQYPPNADQEYESQKHDPEFEIFSLNAFIFTWKDDVNKLTPRIEKWIDQCYKIALLRWGDLIVENV